MLQKLFKNISTDNEVISKIKVAYFFLGHGIDAGEDKQNMLKTAWRRFIHFEQNGDVKSTTMSVVTRTSEALHHQPRAALHRNDRKWLHSDASRRAGADLTRLSVTF